RILPPGAAAASSGPAPAPGPPRSPGPGPAMWLFSRDPVRDFPFELGPPDADPDAEPLPDPAAPAPLWRLLRGRRKVGRLREGGVPCPLAVPIAFLGPGGDPAATALARAGLKRLRSLRHPNILGYLDSLEVTGPGTPGGQGGQRNIVGMGVSGGEMNRQGDIGEVADIGGMRGTWGQWEWGDIDLPDSWATPTPRSPPDFGVPLTPCHPEPPQPVGSPGSCVPPVPWGAPDPVSPLSPQLPPGLIPPFSELVAADPGARPGPGPLLERLQRPGAFLACALVRTGLFLEHFQVRDPEERRTFLQELPPLLETLPGPFRRHKLLPRLLEALELGSADASALPPLLQVAKVLDPPEYQERIVPVLVRLFSSPERGLRLRLLQLLEEYIEFLPEATVDSQIFPHVAHGFLDSNPAIREQTVKSMVLLAPKRGEGRRGGELPRLLLRVQGGDALGPLRCNATLCLGRLAPHLPPQ
ncbi:SCYL1 protein, partial [Picathartes gymnocephalus]|nr:SCYL1 protein [Picathartes gymnocephalus]